MREEPKGFISWADAKDRKTYMGCPVAPDRVRVYFNLNLDCLSVIDAETGRLYCHAHRVELHAAQFRVQEAGRQRVLREKRKNVHAGIRGDWLTYSKYYGHEVRQWGPSPKSMLKEMKSMATLPEHSHYVHKQITYDPYKYETFVTVEDGEPIYDSPTVFVGHECWALTIPNRSHN